jgi:hypothetical protein
MHTQDDDVVVGWAGVPPFSWLERVGQMCSGEHGEMRNTK